MRSKMLDATKATAAEAKAATTDFAGQLQGFAGERAADAAAPITGPVTVDQVARAPKVAPAAPPPSAQVDVQRVLDAKGKIVGLDIVPLPGNAVVRIELRDLKDKRWRVGVFTQPRRGRSFRERRKPS